MKIKEQIKEILDRRDTELKELQEKKIKTIEDLKKFRDQRVQLKQELREAVLEGKDSKTIREKLKDNEDAEMFTRQVEKELIEMEQEIKNKYLAEFEGKYPEFQEAAIKDLIPTVKKINKLKKQLEEAKLELNKEADLRVAEIRKTLPDSGPMESIGLKNYFLSTAYQKA